MFGKWFNKTSPSELTEEEIEQLELAHQKRVEELGVASFENINKKLDKIIELLEKK